LLALKARLLEIQEHQEMSALFPSFLSLGQRIKRLLATDIKGILQALEGSVAPTEQEFYDNFIYHPPIV
jgi:hypothetical protein